MNNTSTHTEHLILSPKKISILSTCVSFICILGFIIYFGIGNTYKLIVYQVNNYSFSWEGLFFSGILALSFILGVILFLYPLYLLSQSSNITTYIFTPQTLTEKFLFPFLKEKIYFLFDIDTIEIRKYNNSKHMLIINFFDKHSIIINNSHNIEAATLFLEKNLPDFNNIVDGNKNNILLIDNQHKSHIIYPDALKLTRHKLEKVNQHIGSIIIDRKGNVSTITSINLCKITKEDEDSIFMRMFYYVFSYKKINLSKDTCILEVHELRNILRNNQDILSNEFILHLNKYDTVSEVMKNLQVVDNVKDELPV